MTAKIFNKFSAKILLFGEYTVLFGSKALSLPFKRYSGFFERYYDQRKKYNSENEKSLTFSSEFISSHKVIKELFMHLQSVDKKFSGSGLSFADKDFMEDLSQGLYFQSTIPQGKGLGSSGALCASLLNQYFLLNGKRICKLQENCEDYYKLQKVLSYLEEPFHGQSSGLDGLVSFLGCPLSVKNERGEGSNKEVRSSIFPLEVKNLNPLLSSLFILDTNEKRQDKNLIPAVIKHLQEKKNSSQVAAMIENVNALVDFMVTNNHLDQWNDNKSGRETFQELFSSLSKKQLLLLKPFIPTSIQDLWVQGIETHQYYMKFCGAGGGGNYIFYSPSHESRKLPKSFEQMFDAISLPLGTSQGKGPPARTF